jgi:hypothetical protein
MTSCCWSLWDTDTTNVDLVDNIIIYSEDGLSRSRSKQFLTEYIRINATTFFLSKKSLDGRVQVILTFYDTQPKPQFVRGFLYIGGKEYSIKTYNNDTFSLYN